MKTLVIDPLSPRTIRALEKDVDLYYLPNITKEEIEKELPNTSILIMRSAHVLTPEMVNAAVNLKAVIRAGNGIENIPVDVLREKGIFFSNIKSVSGSAVAEYVIGLIILAMRNLIPAVESINKKVWHKEQLIGNEINGKILGLIGFGGIGSEIAKKIESLGMEVIYNNNSGPIENVKYRHVSKEDLFIQADIISIQIPLSNETYKLINSEALQLMKRTAIIINVSRYDIIDMDSIESFVKDGKIRGIYIDPFEKKYFSEVDRFSGLPVYFFPHLGANTLESQDKIGEEVLELIKKIKLT